jgi:glycosyltransferase involved in cell wall biosynthesis
MNECAFIGNFLSKLFGIPHIVSLMGQDVQPSNKYLKYIYFNSQRRTKIISLSNYASEIFNKSIPRGRHEAHKIIPFGIDENHFPVSMGMREIDVIGVGSLISLKNYNLFIEIIDVLRKDFINLKTVIIGNGIQRRELEDNVMKRNLNENIEFKGHLQREEVLKYMMQSKIFLHTSIFESQGYVFLEALKSGLNIVTFNVGFLPQSKKIHLCRNKNEMIDEVKMLLNSELDHSSEIPFTMKETVKRFRSVYRDLNILN